MIINITDEGLQDMKAFSCSKSRFLSNVMSQFVDTSKKIDIKNVYTVIKYIKDIEDYFERKNIKYTYFGLQAGLVFYYDRDSKLRSQVVVTRSQVLKDKSLDEIFGDITDNSCITLYMIRYGVDTYYINYEKVTIDDDAIFIFPEALYDGTVQIQLKPYDINDWFEIPVDKETT